MNVTIAPDAPGTDVPVAANDTANVTEDQSVNIPVLANDTFGPDGPSTGAIVIATPAANGTATVNNNGTPNDPTDDTIDYTPNANFNGSDSFTYTITDSNGDTSTATVNVTIAPDAPGTDVPVASNDTANVTEDQSVNIPVLANDTFGPDGPSIGAITIATPATNGTATVNNNGTPNDPTDDTIDYTPNANFNGSDSFTYTITDSNGDTSTATVNVTIAPDAPGTDVPVAANDTANVTEDQSVNIAVLANDTFGPDGPSTGAITIATPATNGTATVNNNGTPNDPTDDTIDYTPNANFNGSDSFTYTITDSNGDTSTATVNVTIAPDAPGTDVPVAANDTANVTEDLSVNIPVLANDTFGPDGPSAFAIAIATPAANGTATVNNNGTPNDPTDDTIDYTPNANFNGSDSFTYTITDSNGDTSTATVNVTIAPDAPGTDVPVASNDTANVTEDQSVNIPVLANDTFGPDGPSTGAIVIATPAANGTATVNNNGTPNDPTDDTIDYTPNANFNGSDSFTYTITDSNGDTSTATVTVTIAPDAPGTDVPVASNDTANVTEDQSVNIPVLANDTFGPDGPSTGAIVIATPAANGTATVNNNGTPNDPTDDTIDYTPNADFNGSDSFTYTITDSNGDTSTATVNVTIAPDAPGVDSPLAVNDTVTTGEGFGVTVSVLVNDSFGADGPSVGAITAGPAANGSVSVNTNGTPNDPTDDTITYVPNPNYNGTDSFTYTICDADGQCATATVTVTVTPDSPFNDAPLAVNDTASTNEDTAVVITVLTNDDFGGDGPGVGPIIVTQGLHGTVSVNTNGTPFNPTDDTVTYVPSANYNGSDSFTYTITDSDGQTSTATVTITIIADNPTFDTPTASADTAGVAEGGSVVINVTANDDFGGDGPSVGAITIGSNPSNGIAVVNNNGTPNDPTDDTVTYTPGADFNGVDSFTYTICDADGQCSTATVTIIVTPDNPTLDMPAAVNDTATTAEDTAVIIPVLLNDSFGGDGPSSGSISVTQGANGTVTVNNNGTPFNPTDDTVTYTPNANFNGVDSFTYTISDADGQTSTATVTVTVTADAPGVDMPTANNDTVSVQENTPVTISVLANDSFGGDGPSVGAITVTQGSNGTVTVNTNGTPSDPTDDTITYTPATDFNGVDSFTYTICDADGQCATATVTVTVSADDPNADFPVAQPDTANTVEEVAISIPVLANDSFGGDGPGVGPITVTQGTNGTVTVNNNGTPNNPSDDTVVYTPNVNFSGTDSFTYTIADADGQTSTATVTVTVTPGDPNADFPVAANDTASIIEDTPVTVNVLVNDSFGGDGPSTGAIVIASNPSNGIATVNTNGTPNDPTDDTITYTPNANFNGSDSFTYTIADADGQTSTATVSITVTGDNPLTDMPLAVNDTATTAEDTLVNITVLTNDSFGGDGPSSGSIAVASQPSNGVAVVLNQGTLNDPTDDTITYVPNANFHGTDSFTYTITDADGQTSTATVTITVTADNPATDMPDANDDTYATAEDTPITMNVLGNDSFGGDGPSVGAITVTQGANGTVTVNTNGTPNDPSDDTITYTPNANFNGADSFTYTICDADGQCSTATVNIGVMPDNPLNDAPVAANDSVTITEGNNVNIAVLANDSFGGDGPSNGAIFVGATPSNGIATVNLNGTPNDPTDDFITYIPNPGFNGSDSFTYIIEDADGQQSTATVTITVTPNDPTADVPSANNDVVTTAEDTPVVIGVLVNDFFGLDGPSTGAIVIQSQPVHGTAIVNDNGTPNNPTDDTITYTPSANYHGNDTFNYTIADSNGDTATASVSITITADAPTVDMPLAANDTATTDEELAVTISVLANDSFGGDGPSTGAIAIASTPSNGVAVVNTNGTPNNPADDTITYTPNANFSGTDSFTYTIADADGQTSTATVTITVNANDPSADFPVAANDFASATEDTPVTISVLANDSFGGDGPSTGAITIAMGASNGTATVNNNGTPNNPTDDTITYTPNANFHGNDVFTYTIADADGQTSTATVFVNVAADADTADAPTAVNDTATVSEDQSVSLPVLVNDSFGGDGPFAGPIFVMTQPSNGVAVVNNNGTPNNPLDDTITYTPNANFNGSDSFTYMILDADGQAATATVTITVTPDAPTADMPLAVNDTATTGEDTPVSVLVVLNDSFGGDGPSASAIVVASQPSNGSAVVNNNGTPSNPTDDTITYTPNANFFGTDSFTYTIFDADGQSSTATVTITVSPDAPGADVPVAVNDLATVTEDQSVVIPVVANDSFGGDGPGVVQIVVASQPSNGSAVVNTNGTPSDPTDDTVTYTPNANFNGSDSFTYTIADSNGDTSTATVNVTINPDAPGADSPLAVNDTATANEDSFVVINVLVNDNFGTDGPCACAITVTPAANGAVVVNNNGTPNDPTDDTITYTPNPNFNGTDQFNYTISDADGQTSTATVTITVNPDSPFNDTPTAVNDTATTNEDTAVIINVLVNDSFGGDNAGVGPITVTQGANGTVTVNTNGTPFNPADDTVTYTPNVNFNGTDTFTYTIADSDGQTSTATVTVTINADSPTFDTPTAVADIAAVAEDSSIVIPVIVNDNFGGDGPSSSPIVLASTPTNGNAVVNDNGTPNNPTDDTITYTPNPNFNGIDSFCYTIADADGQTSTACVTVTVTPDNPIADQPVAANDVANTQEDTPVTVTVLANDTFGGDGPSASPILVTQPTNGTAVVNTNGTPTNPTDDTVTYTPNANFNGTDTFTYTITDADGQTSTATVTITITADSPSIDMPTAVNDAVTVQEGTPTTINVLVNDSFGGDGPGVGPIVIATPASNGTAVVNNNGTPNDPTDDTIVYTPNANFNGVDTFCYTIADADGQTATACVNVTVTQDDPNADFPVAQPDTATTTEDVAVTIPVLTNDDFGGDGPGVGPVVISTPATSGTAVVINNGTPNNPTDDTILYTPNPNFHGTDTFCYTISDADGQSATTCVTVTVNPDADTADFPVAQNDSSTTAEDVAVTVNVLVNDNFGGDGPSTGAIVVATIPANGIATVNNNGTPNNPTDDTITYTPNANFNGTDSFTYTIADADGQTSTATVTITITADNPLNDVPVAVDDTATTNEDTSVTVSVLINDNFGGDGPTSGTILVASQPANGTAVVLNAGTINDPTDDTILYIPNANFHGTDAFTYTITDADGQTSTATVTITVNPDNVAIDQPDANDETVSTPEDTPITVNVLSNDTFGGDGPGVGPIVIVTPPANGIAVVNVNGTPNDPTDDTITYTPNPNYNGSDAVVYTITDADGQTATATLFIAITPDNPLNDVPTAVDDSVSLTEGNSVNIAVLANDSFGGDGPSNGAIFVGTTPSNGIATVNLNGTPNDPTDDFITYIPNPGYNGPDSFTYIIEDADGQQSTATVTINVTPNDPNVDVPSANNDTVTTAEDTPVAINVLVNDFFGLDGPNSGTILIQSQPTHGDVVVNNNGTPNDPTDDTITYTPDANYHGNDTFNYTITDSNGSTATASVNITITPDAPTTDAPLAVNDTATTNEEQPVTISVLGNDDFGGDGPCACAVVIASGASNGVAVLNNNGTPNNPADDTVTYTPNANFSGTDSFTYTITDADGQTSTATVTITVIANDPTIDQPSAVNDAVSTLEDTPLTINVLVNDNFGGDGPSSTPIVIASNPLSGTAVVNTNGTPNNPTDDTITYTPNANFCGNDVFTYSIFDADGQSSTAFVIVNVICDQTDVPVAVNDVATTVEDTPVTVNVLANDSFGGDGPFAGAIAITTQPLHGSVIVNNNGTPTQADDTVTYVPNQNYNGTDSFCYTIRDADGQTATACVTVTITPDTVTADAPLAVNDSATTLEDTAVNINVLVNDNFGGDGPSNGAIVMNTQPSNGIAVVNDNGTPSDPTDDFFTYTPNANFFGSDSFTYTIADADGQTATATVTITVTADNSDVPTAVDDTATTPQDTPVTVNVLINDTFGGDGKGNVQIITSPIVVQGTPLLAPSNGTIVVNTNNTPNDPADDTITYTPNAGFVGTDCFEYLITDANGDTDRATVCITASGVNQLPVAVNDTATTNEDNAVTINVVANDNFNTDGPSVSGPVVIATTPANGNVTVNDNNTATQADDTVTYTPNADFCGTDSFTYTIADANGDTSTATVTVTVICVNDLPVAADDAATTNEETAVTITVLANDTFGGDGPNVGTIIVATQPSNGTATLNTNGTPTNPTDDTITYVPAVDFVGTDSFTYTIIDANGDTSTATVTINVINVPNDVPSAVNDAATTNEDNAVTINVLTNDSFGGDGPSVSGPIVIASNPANGAVAVDDNGTATQSDDTVVYTPNANFCGTDSFTYTIADADGQTSTATVTINVTCDGNDLPIANDDSAVTPEDTPVIVNVLANDTFGPDGPNVGTIVVASQPVNGTATLNVNGTPSDPTDDTIIYTPNANYCTAGGTPDSFTYMITDADGDTDIATVTVTVTCDTNDLPVALDDAATTNEDTPVVIAVLTNDNFGPDGASSTTIVVATQPANGTATMNDGGTPNDPTDDTITYIPNADYCNTAGTPDSFTYTIADANGDTATATVTINVTCDGNDVPDAIDDAASTLEDTAVTIDVLTNDTFGPDGPNTGSIIVMTQPANGTAVVDMNGTPTDPTDDTIVYTPNANYCNENIAPDSFTYLIADADGDTDIAMVTVTVTCDNTELPVALDDAATTNEDTPVVIAVLTNDDFGPDGPSNTPIVVATQPANGTATVNDGGTPNDPTDDTITYTPNANYCGADSFTYTIADANGDTATATVTVDVICDAVPTAVNDTATTTEGTQVQILWLGNDSFGADGPSLSTIVIASDPANGTVIVDNNNTPTQADDMVTYVPNAGFCGVDTFTYTISDVDGDSATATVTITVACDQFPDATDEAVTTNEDTLIDIDVLSNDSFGGDGPNTGSIIVVDAPLHGTAVVDTHGTPTDPTDDTIVYTPAADYCNTGGPTDSFTYLIADADGDTANATVTIVVNCIDEFPTAVADAVTTNEDNAITIDVLDNDDFGNDGKGTVAVIVATQPANGTATLNDGGTPNDPTDDTITYTPNTNYCNTAATPDSFTYTITDADGDTSTATVTIIVNCENDVPLAVNDAVTTAEDTAVTISILGNDSFGGDGPSIMLPITTTNPSNGTVTVNDNGTPTQADDTITYTPNANYCGTDSFTYTIADADGNTSTATVNVTITCNPNDVPLAVDDTAVTDQNLPVVITVLGNDTFGGDGPSTAGPITIATSPANGTVTVNDNGTATQADDTVTYTPNPDYSGPDSFQYTITDADGQTSTATVTITINVTIHPSIKLKKTAVTNDVNNDGQIGAGDTITYTFEVTNTGDVLLNNVSISDPTISLNPITVPSPLTPGQVVSVPFTYTITQADVNAGQVVNTAVVSGTTPGGTTVTDTSDNDGDDTNGGDTPTVTPIPMNPELEFIKTGVYVDDNANGIVDTADTVVYTFVIRNTGNVTVTNILINDALTGTVLVPLTPSTLNPGESGTMTPVVYHINQTNINAGLVINSASVTGSDPNGDTVSDVSDEGVAANGDDNPTIVYLGVPKLTLIKTASVGGTGAVGDTITYTFQVTNTGTGSISNIVINDARIGVVNLAIAPATLAPGQVGTVTAPYVITAADMADGQVVNTAVATGTNPEGGVVSDDSDNDGVGENDPTIVILQESSDIQIVKTGSFIDTNEDGFAQVGEEIVYTFTVTNTGLTTLYNVTVSDPLPGVILDNNGIIGTIAPGGIATLLGHYFLTPEDITRGSVTNQASVRGYSPSGEEIAVDVSSDINDVDEEPTIIEFDGCTIKVYNLVSPNGDGFYEELYIQGIVCFPDNTVEIYNRWGILVYETKGYDNTTKAFRGVSEGRVTIDKSAGLPEGTYYWVIKYKDGVNTREKAGFLHLTR
ncbi:hypothetical protein HYN49_00135 [Flavobacterium pallidum]|uniref:DUF7507 domain-containing protein n=1 Tax=Flavobacterium pallidum TaxID=2172098 RepID=A0A2S1SDF5_9FLAO|nr:hypothetical protein HYN49_00135 [Flavobacterium pallidum]